MIPTLTQHAAIRMQQRAIPREAIETVLDYGREVHDHHGGVVCFLDKAAIRRAERDLGHNSLLRRYSRAARAYVVLGRDGVVVTVGHRTSRLPHL